MARRPDEEAATDLSEWKRFFVWERRYAMSAPSGNYEFGCALSLDEALKQEVASAYDWYDSWSQVQAFDLSHPEQPDTNASLMAKLARPLGATVLPQSA